jgi:glutamate racemase
MIGVFDSGVGGLTVLRALREGHPRSDFLYLGDTARLPYGTKSPQVVRGYALRCARFLVERGAESLVVACNTASAVAVEAVQEMFGIAVTGVIAPGARAAAAVSAGPIGVIGTPGTIASGRYTEYLMQLRPDLRVIERACPLFVPLAEEDLALHPATELLARDYLRPLLDAAVDTIVLGCTHYPILLPVLRRLANVHWVDSASALAAELSAPPGQGTVRLFCTDVPAAMPSLVTRFLGEALPVEQVDLEG